MFQAGDIVLFIDEEVEEEFEVQVEGITAPEHPEDVFAYIIARGKDVWVVRPSEVWALQP